jgi:diguanylate cyclase (GGDEF)-like protein
MKCVRCGTRIEAETVGRCPACNMPFREEDLNTLVDKAYLCGAPGRGRFVELRWKDSYILGRVDSADIVLPNNAISRKHAKISWDDGQFHIMDLNAANGTFVNKVRITRGPLVDGDVIGIGPFDLTYRTIEPDEKEWGDAETWKVKPEQVFELESHGAKVWAEKPEAFREGAGAAAIRDVVHELRRLALLDALTGLPNRRYLERTLHSRFDRMRRYDEPFGILFMDIDNFKKVNDSYGHDVGDKILKMAAQTLARNTRSFDVVGRWGGEEFVAIIAKVTGEELPSIAEKFHSLVEQSELPYDSGSLHVTVSIGATLARPGDTRDVLIKKVDRLMYRSKAQGRNCTTVVFRRPPRADKDNSSKA